MEQNQAEEISKDVHELTDLQDDQVLENNDGAEITTDIQAAGPKKKTKRDRSPAQQAAFKKAQEKLKEKREAAKRAKDEQQSESKLHKTQPKPKQRVKRPPRVIEVSETESSSDDEIVYVTRKRPARKQRPAPKRSKQVVYVDSSSEEEEAGEEEQYEKEQPVYQSPYPAFRFV